MAQIVVALEDNTPEHLMDYRTVAVERIAVEVYKAAASYMAFEVSLYNFDSFVFGLGNMHHLYRLAY